MFILIFPEEKSHDGAIKQLESVVSGGSGLDVQSCSSPPFTCFHYDICPLSLLETQFLLLDD